MRRCIELARTAQRNGDAPVGSVIVRDGQIIAEGLESVKANIDPAAHAEIEAVRVACRVLNSFNLSGCALYTTAEPCWMCSYAIRRTGISQVIIGAPVPYVGGATSPHPILTDPAIECWPHVPTVAWSNLRPECERLTHKLQTD